MKTKIKNYAAMMAMVFSMLFAFSPLFNVAVHAAPPGGGVNNCGDPSLIPDPNTGVCVPATTAVGGTPTVNTLLLRAINFLLSVAAIIAILYIIWGGFQYITSAGNEEKAQSGRRTLVNAMIGLAVVILAYTIVGIINNTVAGCFGGFLGGIFGGC